MSFVYDYICTYPQFKDEDPEDILYKKQFLQAFNLTDWDENIINKVTGELYEKVKDNEQFTAILDLAPNTWNPENKEISFIALFSYEYFDLFHRCLGDFLRYNHIKEENYNNLINKLNG